MARTDNLSNFLTDVAGAIKEKKGDTSTPIPAKSFDEEIKNLPSGGGDDISEYIDGEVIKSLSDTNSSIVYASPAVVRAIKKLPPLRIKSSAKINSLFRGLYSLKALPAIEIDESSNEVTFEDICCDCLELEDILTLKNVLDKYTVTKFNNAFLNCKLLTDVSILENTFANGEIININGCFGSCKNLENVPDLNIPKVNNINNLFAGCQKLKMIPNITLEECTQAESTFSNCQLIETIPEMNLAKCKSFYNFLYGTTNLHSVPKLNFSSANNLTSLLYGTHDLLTDLGGFENLGFSYTQKQKNYNYYKLNLSTCPNLTHDSLMNVINNVYDLNKTYEGEQTEYTQQIDLHANSLALLSEDEIAIATGKGWSIM